MKKLLNKLKTFTVMASMTIIMPYTAFAATGGNKIMESTIGVGLMAMLKDLGVFAMIAGGLVGLISTIINIIKKNAAEANENGSGTRYNKAIALSIGCGVAVFLVGGLFTLVGSYFGINVVV